MFLNYTLISEIDKILRYHTNTYTYTHLNSNRTFFNIYSIIMINIETRKSFVFRAGEIEDIVVIIIFQVLHNIISGTSSKTLS